MPTDPHQPVRSTHVVFPFAFNTPGLAAGVVAYVPSIGDILLDAWVEVDAAWDGTTPLCDFGTFVGTAAGLFAGAPVDLTKADSQGFGTGLLTNGGQGSLAGVQNGAAKRVVPATFVAANPLKVAVSRDGTAGGVATGATHGSASLHLLVELPD